MSAKSTSAIRLVFSSAGKTKLRFVFLQCRVKPGANKQREGIVAVTEEVIDLCVSAQAREGEANKAVKGLFSKVLKVPKSDVEVVKGLKSREKTVEVSGIDTNKDAQECIMNIKQQLLNAIE